MTSLPPVITGVCFLCSFVCFSLTSFLSSLPLSYKVGAGVGFTLSASAFAFSESYRHFVVSCWTNPWLLLLGVAVGVTVAVLEDSSDPESDSDVPF